MIRKLSLYTCLLLLFLMFFGCTKSQDIVDESIDNPPVTVEKFYDYYTGVECSKDDNNKTAFMTIIENSSSARPQSGLSYADIIYETSAEGGIPRFLALFSSELPSIIGPVRSIRPYFIDIVKEFDLPVAHCGGSSDALTTIKNDPSIISINEINEGSYFWRDSSRKAPHNLYTSSDNIKKYMSDKNIKITNSKFAYFDDSFFNNSNLESASKINIQVNRLYNTSYEYKNNSYYKFMDSEKAIDTINNNQISFSNIIIQKTPITLCSDKSHLNIPLIGEGEGFILSKGKIINMKWKRDSKNSKTTFFDQQGNNIPLSPGKTIFNIIDINSKIEIQN